jgi:hypothetical protein
MLNSGATDYIFWNKNLLKLKLVKDDKYMFVANGMKAKINGMREINLFSTKIKIYIIYIIFLD